MAPAVASKSSPSAGPTVFIFHGTGGYPEENWFSWLKQQLETIGCRKVIVPQFPTPPAGGQTPEAWFKVFDRHRTDFTADTILVGHSLGGAFLLRVLERSQVKIKAAFLVAAPVGIPPIKNWATDQPFIGHPFDWAAIRAHCERFFVFHSDDDPYVCLGNGEELARRLGTELLFQPGCGHFNQAAGFVEFPLLLEKVRGVLGS